MTQEYPESVINNAKEYGYKVANLQEAKLLADEFNINHDNHNDQITCEVPKFIPISNAVIMEYLRSNISDFDSRWEEFCRKQGSNRQLTEEARAVLSGLRANIEKCFEEKNFPLEAIDDSFGQLLMVRSTGEEDRVDVANPGGNESVPSNRENISKSIGIVISSYISEKSLSQRLALNENITARYPLSPCLIQSLVSANHESDLRPGVVYTNNGHTRIQSALGHGELVVNSKGNVDNYYVSPKNNVYAEIKYKHIKLVPELNQETNKFEQKIVENSFTDASAPSLPYEVVQYINDLSKHIAAHYKMRMDIEFVYDQHQNKVNIVQIRAIPDGDRKAIIPSALSNEYISQNHPQGLKGAVITPEVIRANVIENPSEILVCDTISQALQIYLNDLNRHIKAVIIQQPAPDTSHEAGMFSTKAIPVLQINNTSDAKKWIEDLENNVLIIDPQHNKLYKIERNFYNENLIQEGLFASTLTPFVSTLPHVVTGETTEKYFQLINQLKKEDIIVFRDPKLLRKSLENIKIPPSDPSGIEEQKKLLSNLLLYSARGLNNHKISPELVKEIFKAGSELNDVLIRMEADASDEIKTHYLNVSQKLEGLVMAQRSKDVMSASIVEELRVRREDAKYLDIANQNGLPDEQKTFFLESCKVEKFIFTDENKEKWRQFCFDACKKNQGESLVLYCKTLVKNNIHEYVLNSSFINKFDQDRDNALPALYKDVERSEDKIANLNRADNILRQMEAQIGEWGIPRNSEKLFSSMQNNIQELGEILSFNDERKFKEGLRDDISGMILLDKVNRMIDIIDLSIKSLQTSSQYQTESEKMKQVAMFGEMVKEFSGVMNKIIYEVEGDSPYNVNNIKSNIKEILEYKKQSLSVSDLDISREFSVNYAQTNIRSIKKIADIHTVIHQTCLDSIGRYNSRIMERVKLQYPAEIQKLKELVEKGESDIGINSQKLPYLISSKFIYPEIELSYNIPLRDHSGNIAIKYDLNKKKYKISYKLYGGNEDYRWNNVCNYGKIFFDNFINYNRISNDFNDSGVHFEVEISDKESLEKAVKIFYTFSQASFDSNILQNLFKEGGNYYNQTLEKFNELSTVLNLTEIQREFVAEACVSGLVSLKEIKEKKVLDRVLVLEEKIASKELQNIWRLQSLRSLLFCPQKRFDILLSPEWKSYNINLSTILDCGERDSRVLSDEAFLAYKNKFSLRDVLYLYNNGNLVHYAANNQNLNIVKSIVNDSRSSKDGKALAFKLLYRSLASSSASANKDEFLECASEYKNIYNFLHNKQEDDYFCETEHRALISYAIRDNNPNILKVLIEVSRDCGMELQFSDLLLLRGIDEKGLKSFVKVAVELKMDDSLVKSILKYPDDFTKALNLLLEGGVDVNTIQKYQDKITRACPSMKSKVEEYIASKSLQEEALSATSGIGEFISKVSNAQNPENVERAHTTMKIPPDSDKQGRPL